jgi:hypothetical protein
MRQNRDEIGRDTNDIAHCIDQHMTKLKASLQCLPFHAWNDGTPIKKWEELFKELFKKAPSKTAYGGTALLLVAIYRQINWMPIRLPYEVSRSDGTTNHIF